VSLFPLETCDVSEEVLRSKPVDAPAVFI